MYKTIMLEMIEAKPTLHDSLRNRRQLPQTVESLAATLRDEHLTMKAQFQAKGFDSLTASHRALGVATANMEAMLNESPSLAVQPAE